MTEQLKQERYSDHISRAFKEAVDPMNWESRVAFVKSFMKRVGYTLPDEIKNKPLQHLAHHSEDLIRAWTQSLDRFKGVLRSL